ncbi:MAG: phosphoglycerate kinase [Candidatus Heimdallarchaeaceae archaeon]
MDVARSNNRYSVSKMKNLLKFREKKSITDIDLRNKTVLVRVDFNVPLDEYRQITDSRRIRYTLPTLFYLHNERCKIVVISHLGRPGGKRDEKYNLLPVYKRLKEFFPLTTVYRAQDCIGHEVENMIKEMKPGEILLLENPRFYPGEKANDPDFAKKLAKLADVYINDAFATSHRKHASTYGVTSYLKESGYGFLVEKEMKFFSQALSNPKRPFTVILGGKKVKDKLDVIKHLIGVADNIIIGGGMAYTFLLAEGYNIGKSVRDLSKLTEVRDYIKECNANGTRIYLPKDVVVCDELDFPRKIEEVPITTIGENHIAVDIGTETIQQYKNILAESKQVIWQGPLGVFEKEEFERGTKEIARFLIENKIYSIICGGDSAAAFEKFGFQDDVSFISTGGGASLALMKGELLPGIECLSDKEE